ncbi:MAG: hypothetical protein WC343_14015 [Bacilli bacterium]
MSGIQDDERRTPMAYVTQEAFVEALGNIDAKLDKISERQIDYIERTVRIEAIVTNGLASTVNGLRKDMAQYISAAQQKFDDFDKRLCIVETFAWFRDWVTALKDTVFKNFLKILIAGALLAAATFCEWDKIKGFWG